MSRYITYSFLQGKWTKPFDKEITRDSDFHVTKDKTITVPMMYQSDNFKYGESAELDAKVKTFLKRVPRTYCHG